MTRSERFVAGVFVAASLLSLGACNRNDSAVPKVNAEDPAAMVARENREIAERLAKQKAELEENSSKARTAEEARAAEEARGVAIGALVDIRQKWLATLRDAGTTTRSEGASLLARMEAIQAAAQALKVTECLEKPRSTLVSGISTGLSTYREFMQATGEPTSEMRRKLADAQLLFERVDPEMQACGG
jgi:hypothetical protein